MNKKCLECNTLITSKTNKLFCSVLCYKTEKARKTKKEPNKICNFCQSSIYRRENHIKYFCDRECKRKFETTNNNKIRFRKYRKKALKYLKKICSRCNYSENQKAIIVHHKDRNRMNNDISNLEILCGNCHFIEHYGK